MDNNISHETLIILFAKKITKMIDKKMKNNSNINYWHNSEASKFDNHKMVKLFFQ